MELQQAIRLGDVPELERLLAMGMDPIEKDPQGNTLLHHAAMRDQAVMVPMLVGAGLDPNQTNPGQFTPLHLAAQFGQEAAAQKLVEAGANVLAKDRQDRTAYDLARERGHHGLAGYLYGQKALLTAAQAKEQARDVLAVDLEDAKESLVASAREMGLPRKPKPRTAPGQDAGDLPDLEDLLGVG